MFLENDFGIVEWDDAHAKALDMIREAADTLQVTVGELEEWLAEQGR